MKSYFAVCLNCGSFFPRESLFCESCQDRLFSLRKKDPSLVAFKSIDFRVYALWDWVPSRNRPLSRLLIQLKRGREELASAFYAKALLQWRMSGIRHPDDAHLQMLEYPEDLVLLPCPPGKETKKDHATVLADHLAMALLGRSSTPKVVLKKMGDGSQKARSRPERFRLALEGRVFSLEGQPPPSHRSIVFVDDIVTTGCTALAAYIALDCPPKFEVWCLARRKYSW